jgi:hypothetical protein
MTTKLTHGEIMRATRTTQAGTPYTDCDLLPLEEEEKAALQVWMKGKTCPLVDGVSNAAYLWDVESWAQNV